MGVVGETIENYDMDAKNTQQQNGSSRKPCINGARVVDKSRQYPMYRLEIWMNTRNPEIKERIKQRMIEIITDGQPPSRKGHPKFDWKDHSA